MSTGWIKLHRELLDKPIWESSTPEQKVILVTLLAMANHAEKEWEFGGEKYKAMPGQFVTSLPSIAKKSGNGISIQNVRTALLRFERYDFLTCKSTNKNRLITIVNWEFYQQKEDNLTGKSTGDQQATNRQLTANKNVKNVKNDKEEVIKDIVPFPFEEIVTYLNEKAKTNYRHSGKKTQTLIKARLKEGFKLEDFQKVIDIKSSQWLSDSKMANYLRPETLFGNKFESYLNEGVSNNAINRTGSRTNDENQSKISAANERRKRLAGIEPN